MSSGENGVCGHEAPEIVITGAPLKDRLGPPLRCEKMIGHTGWKHRSGVTEWWTYDPGRSADGRNLMEDGTPYPTGTAEADCVLEPHAHLSCMSEEVRNGTVSGGPFIMRDEDEEVNPMYVYGRNDELIWEGSVTEYGELLGRLEEGAQPSLSNNHGKVCAAGMEPDTEYLVVRAKE